MKLLLVEDDFRLAEHLIQNFRAQGILALHMANVDSFKEFLSGTQNIEFVILDRLLGTFDTKTFMPQIRQKWPTVPILILSAISTPNERTDLINLGADDYLGKPFSTQELIARIGALRRRTSSNQVTPYLQVGNLTIDTIRRVMSVGAANESLPAKEFMLLKTLVQEPGRVWNRADLLDYVWGISTEVDTNVVESTIANLRKKIGELGSRAVIRNARNAGYWIEA